MKTSVEAPPSAEPERLDTMTVAEAATLTGLPKLAFYRALAAGRLPEGIHFRFGKRFYLRKGQLLAWLKAGGMDAGREDS